MISICWGGESNQPCYRLLWKKRRRAKDLRTDGKAFRHIVPSRWVCGDAGRRDGSYLDACRDVKKADFLGQGALVRDAHVYAACLPHNDVAKIQRRGVEQEVARCEVDAHAELDWQHLRRQNRT